MNEKRKQELKKLLKEASKNLQIRYNYGPLSLPPDVYRKYLQERWASYGVDFLSFSFSTRFRLDVVRETTKSKLLDFIREELVLFIEGDNVIPTGSYVIESDSTDGFRLCRFQRLYLDLVLERLLEIAIVRGIDEAVSAFDRSSCSKGTHSFFQHVALLAGIKLKTEIQVFEGVRLVPLPSSKTSEEVVRYLPGFPSHAFVDQAGSFFGKTLLIIDRPGLSIFHKPPGNPFQSGPHPFQGEIQLDLDDLPFQFEEHDVKFPSAKSVNSFNKSFYQALSLACNSPVQIDHLGWFLEDDKSLHAHSGMIRTRYPFLERSSFGSSTEVGQPEIDEAKRLYDILVSLDSKIGEKLQIPINRWIKSKAVGNSVDKMIDLGIALESLYLPETNTDQLSFSFRLCASWHLGKNKAEREMLIEEFKEIYTLRSKAVHNGKLPQTVKIRNGESVRTSKFIEKAQDLCRESIMKILEDGNFPDWNSLILG